MLIASLLYVPVILNETIIIHHLRKGSWVLCSSRLLGCRMQGSRPGFLEVGSESRANSQVVTTVNPCCSSLQYPHFSKHMKFCLNSRSQLGLNSCACYYFLQHFLKCLNSAETLLLGLQKRGWWEGTSSFIILVWQPAAVRMWKLRNTCHAVKCPFLCILFQCSLSQR